MRLLCVSRVIVRIGIVFLRYEQKRRFNDLTMFAHFPRSDLILAL
jgi:hypothetical protein